MKVYGAVGLFPSIGYSDVAAQAAQVSSSPPTPPTITIGGSISITIPIQWDDSSLDGVGDTAGIGGSAQAPLVFIRVSSYVGVTAKTNSGGECRGWLHRCTTDAKMTGMCRGGSGEHSIR